MYDLPNKTFPIRIFFIFSMKLLSPFDWPTLPNITIYAINITIKSYRAQTTSVLYTVEKNRKFLAKIHGKIEKILWPTNKSAYRTFLTTIFTRFTRTMKLKTWDFSDRFTQWIRSYSMFLGKRNSQSNVCRNYSPCVNVRTCVVESCLAWSWLLVGWVDSSTESYWAV